MNETELQSALERRIRRIFAEDWKFHKERPGYWKRLHHAATEIEKTLQTLAEGRVSLERPHDDFAYYRLQVAFQAWSGPDHFDGRIHKSVRKRKRPAVFLAILISNIAPVIEATWRVVDRGEETFARDLNDFSAVPLRHDPRPLIEGLSRTCQDVDLTLVPMAITHAPADPSLPAPIWEPPHPRLRDYLFQPCVD